jgi:hypothetical protein
MNTDILELPWQIQVALGSGYAAYLLAYLGARSHHRTIDTAFIALTFGLIATAVLALTERLIPIASGTLAFCASLVVGLLWRRFGMSTLDRALRALNITWSDNVESAWMTVTTSTRAPLSQISVLLDDGTTLECRNTKQFENAAFGPCRLGSNGDVAMYLTHKTLSDGTERTQSTTVDEEWGDRLTYIPAGRILTISMRYLRPSRPSRAAEHSD